MSVLVANVAFSCELAEDILLEQLAEGASVDPERDEVKSGVIAAAELLANMLKPAEVEVEVAPVVAEPVKVEPSLKLAVIIEELLPNLVKKSIVHILRTALEHEIACLHKTNLSITVEEIKDAADAVLDNAHLMDAINDDESSFDSIVSRTGEDEKQPYGVSGAVLNDLKRLVRQTFDLYAESTPLDKLSVLRAVVSRHFGVSDAADVSHHLAPCDDEEKAQSAIRHLLSHTKTIESSSIVVPSAAVMLATIDQLEPRPLETPLPDVIEALSSVPLMKDAGTSLLWDTLFLKAHGQLGEVFQRKDVIDGLALDGVRFVEEPRGCFIRVAGSKDATLHEWTRAIKALDSDLAAAVAAALISFCPRTELEFTLPHLQTALFNAFAEENAADKEPFLRVCVRIVQLLPKSLRHLLSEHVILPTLFSQQTGHGISLDTAAFVSAVTQGEPASLGVVTETVVHTLQSNTVSNDLRISCSYVLAKLVPLVIRPQSSAKPSLSWSSSAPAEELVSSSNDAFSFFSSFSFEAVSVDDTTGDKQAPLANITSDQGGDQGSDSIASSTTATQELTTTARLTKEDVDAMSIDYIKAEMNKMDKNALPPSTAAAQMLIRSRFFLWTNLNDETREYIDSVLSSTVRLSVDLYSNAVHFLYELIQNSDDAPFHEGDLPTQHFTFIASSTGQLELRVHTNETGFRTKDVVAITTTAQSTKMDTTTAEAETPKKKEETEQFTGHKGIGWKSVFTASNRPQVHSGYVHLVLDKRPVSQGGLDRFGQLAPQWVNPVDVGLTEKTPGTTIILPLVSPAPEKMIEATKVNEALNDMSNPARPYIILFLRQLRRMRFTLKSADAPDVERVIERSNANQTIELPPYLTTQGHAASLQTLKVSESNRKDHSTFWLVHAFTPAFRAAPIKLAFPLHQSMFTSSDTLFEPKTQYVFCVLPVEDYGLRFAFQANFVVPSTRESIKKDDLHNVVILNDWLPLAFAGSFEGFRLVAQGQLAKQESIVPATVRVAQLFLAFLPIKKHLKDATFQIAADRVVDKVQTDLPCLVDTVGSWATPRRSVRAANASLWGRISSTTTPQQTLLDTLAACGFIDSAAVQNVLKVHLVHPYLQLGEPVWSALKVADWGISHVTGLLHYWYAPDGPIHSLPATPEARAQRFLATLDLLRASSKSSADQDLASLLGKIAFVPVSNSSSYEPLSANMMYFSAESEESAHVKSAIEVLKSNGNQFDNILIDDAVSKAITKAHRDTLDALKVAPVTLLKLIEIVIIPVLDQSNDPRQIIALTNIIRIWSDSAKRSADSLFERLKAKMPLVTSTDTIVRPGDAQRLHLHHSMLTSGASEMAALQEALAAVNPLLYVTVSDAYVQGSDVSSWRHLFERFGVIEGFEGVPLQQGTIRPTVANPSPFVPLQAQKRHIVNKPTLTPAAASAASTELASIFSILLAPLATQETTVNALTSILVYLDKRMATELVSKECPLGVLLRSSAWISSLKDSDSLRLPADCILCTDMIRATLGNFGVYVTVPLCDAFADLVGIATSLSSDLALSTLRTIERTSNHAVAAGHVAFLSANHLDRTELSREEAVKLLTIEKSVLNNASLIIETRIICNLYSAASRAANIDLQWLSILPLVVPSLGTLMPFNSNPTMNQNQDRRIGVRFVRLDDCRLIGCDDVSGFLRHLDIWSATNRYQNHDFYLHGVYPTSVIQLVNEWTAQDGLNRAWNKALERLQKAALLDPAASDEHSLLGIKFKDDDRPELGIMQIISVLAKFDNGTTPLPICDLLRETEKNVPLLLMLSPLVPSNEANSDAEPKPEPRLVYPNDGTIVVLDDNPPALERMRTYYSGLDMVHSIWVFSPISKQKMRQQSEGKVDQSFAWLHRIPTVQAVSLAELFERPPVGTFMFSQLGPLHRKDWALASALAQQVLKRSFPFDYANRSVEIGRVLKHVSDATFVSRPNIVKEMMSKRSNSADVIVYGEPCSSYLHDENDAKHEKAERDPLAWRLHMDSAHTYLQDNTLPTTYSPSWCNPAILEFVCSQGNPNVRSQLTSTLNKLNDVEFAGISPVVVLQRLGFPVGEPTDEDWYLFEDLWITPQAAERHDSPVREPNAITAENRELQALIASFSHLGTRPTGGYTEPTEEEQQQASENLRSIENMNQASAEQRRIFLEERRRQALLVAPLMDKETEIILIPNTLVSAPQIIVSSNGTAGTPLVEIISATPMSAPTIVGNGDLTYPAVQGSDEHPLATQENKWGGHDSNPNRTLSGGPSDVGLSRQGSNAGSSEWGIDELIQRALQREDDGSDEEDNKPTALDNHHDFVCLDNTVGPAQAPLFLGGYNLAVSLERVMQFDQLLETLRQAGSHSQENGASMIMANDNNHFTAFVGRLGEEYAYEAIKREIGEQSPAQVVWVNKDRESGNPYDIKVMLGERELLYIEVKSTVSSNNLMHFPVSLDEIAFGKSNGKKRKWEICFVHGLRNIDGHITASILRVRNPLESINRIAVGSSAQVGLSLDVTMVQTTAT